MRVQVLYTWKMFGLEYFHTKPIGLQDFPCSMEFPLFIQNTSFTHAICGFGIHLLYNTEDCIFKCETYGITCEMHGRPKLSIYKTKVVKWEFCNIFMV